jgi:TfoX/Sxy family transcriptional regulator of competence genes
MAYDESVALRVRNALAKYPSVEEKKMFGGLAFMVRGYMCIGVNDDDLMVRVGPDGYEAALSDPHAREMDFTGTPLRGYVYVGRAGYASPSGLRRWIDRATGFVQSLPAKPRAKTKPKAKRKAKRKS